MDKSEKYGLLFRTCGCLFLIPLDDILFIEGLSSASPDNGIYHCRGEIVTPLSLEKLLKLEKRENEKIFIVVRNNFGITAKEVLGIELFGDLRQIKSSFVNRAICGLYFVENVGVTAFELDISWITEYHSGLPDAR